MKKHRIAAASIAAALTLAGCSGSSDSASAGGEGGYGDITYWTWNAEQVPGYQACADLFQDQNPGTAISIEQYNWDDYWTKLTASLVAGNPPDVFTDHLSKYGPFVSGKQVLALDKFIERDSFDQTAFQDGLVDPWVAYDEKQYGIPKDWDTIGLFYNADLLTEAGYTAEEAAALDWNPDDGGTFEKFIAHMSIDKNGVRGDEAGFDPANVAVYGMAAHGDGGRDGGQSTWANFAGTTGWEYMNQNPWGTEYNYDDEKFQDTIDWYFGLVDKGFMPGYGVVADGINQIGAGIAATSIVGSWSADSMFSLKDEGINVGLTHTPVGPSGKAASMFNGIADSIPAGADNQEGAWAWISFMGTQECQDIVAEKGTAFPAISASTDKKLNHVAELGRDMSGYTYYLEEGETFLPPISDNSGAISDTLEDAMQAIYTRQKDASSLTEVNEKINAMFR